MRRRGRRRRNYGLPAPSITVIAPPSPPRPRTKIILDTSSVLAIFIKIITVVVVAIIVIIIIIDIISNRLTNMFLDWFTLPSVWVWALTFSTVGVSRCRPFKSPCQVAISMIAGMTRHEFLLVVMAPRGEWRRSWSVVAPSSGTIMLSWADGQSHSFHFSPQTMQNSAPHRL
ncbi:uncharacterized protein DNG_08604 [Cephalotrichum gorgonifer]|uniref:Uncharacterized protein n=1 Tax=Cephalotrichum gorgonifer TaxID=2041049 RepID=A0AAE8N434_9PEZI|nr:uncharacterized protein DNG_08604 [Cephalotrichum gorgonifer]